MWPRQSSAHWPARPERRVLAQTRAAQLAGHLRRRQRVRGQLATTTTGRPFPQQQDGRHPIEAGFLKQLRDAWKTQESAVQGYAEARPGHRQDRRLHVQHQPQAQGHRRRDESAYQQAVMQRVSEAIRTGSNEMAQMLIGSWRASPRPSRARCRPTAMKAVSVKSRRPSSAAPMLPVNSRAMASRPSTHSHAWPPACAASTAFSTRLAIR